MHLYCLRDVLKSSFLRSRRSNAEGFQLLDASQHFVRIGRLRQTTILQPEIYYSMDVPAEAGHYLA